MRGLYILINPLLESQYIIKIGMSMRLHERVYDYNSIFTRNKYCYCYVTPHITKEQILYIEKLVLEKTIDYRNLFFSSEYRNVSDLFSKENYHNLIIDLLELFKIEYKIKIDPVFAPPKTLCVEAFDRVEEMNAIDYNPFNISKRNELQSQYLGEIISELHIKGRVLCVAPTGFGKTIILYKLLNEITSLRKVIIFTPRRILNGQTSSSKYTDILNKSYSKIIFKNKQKSNKNIIDCLENGKRIIIYSCYQSSQQLFQLVKDNQFDLIIFDESHFIQYWPDKMDQIHIKYFIKSKNIKNRLFLTATPTDLMINNEKQLFGKQISLVKVYELINYGILCNVETIIKKMAHNKKEYYDLYSLICSSMNKYHKKKGLIYANTQNNAIQLYKLFNKKNNDVKAYIYVSDKVDVYNDGDDELTTFEDDENPCILITCKKIDYGYDNIWIDFICFADPKSGDIEICQIMGRGLRNDEQVYPNKILHVLLPIYCDETDNEYGHVVAYLKYLVEEAGQDLTTGISSGFQLTGNKKIIHEKIYDGEDIPAEICEKLSTTSYYKYDNFKRFLKENNVYDELTYNRVQEQYEWVPEISAVRKRFKQFCFRDIHPHNRTFYWTKEECVKHIVKAYEVLKNNCSMMKKMDTIKQLHYLNKVDNKIPLIDMDWYYSI